jgi:hypothetical protein
MIPPPLVLVGQQRIAASTGLSTKLLHVVRHGLFNLPQNLIASQNLARSA